MFQTLCVSLQDGTEKPAVVDDVSLFFWVCVSDRGNIVVESGGVGLEYNQEKAQLRSD